MVEIESFVTIFFNKSIDNTGDTINTTYFQN